MILFPGSGFVRGGSAVAGNAEPAVGEAPAATEGYVARRPARL
ncbi:MAG: hypothetical protein ACXVYV_01860 [Gaiellales bacterium]